MLDIILANNKVTFSNFGNVRVTEEGWISVYDLIAVCAESTDRKYPANTWNRLIVKFSEVSSKCRHFKFQGKGQKDTPICDKETALQIIGLLPGTTGQKYRAAAASLVLKYLEAPEELADLATDRMEQLGDLESLERHQARLSGKIERVKFTQELGQRGVKPGLEFAVITNNITRNVVGKTATEIKRETGVKNAREAMDALQLAGIEASEALARVFMMKNNSKGFKDCNHESSKASKIVGKEIN